MKSNQRSMLIPVDLIPSETGQLAVVFFNLPETRFTEPFSIDTLTKRFDILNGTDEVSMDNEKLTRPLHYDLKDPRVTTKQLSEFIEEYSNRESSPHTRFIFHMSRCGSTLATQMLATNQQFHVLVEPSFINRILDPSLEFIDGSERMKAFRAGIHALEDTKPDLVQETFFKFRSWNTLYMERMLKEFPNSQWLFTHRNGIEVLASVLKNPPGWLRSRMTHQKLFAEFIQKLPGENLTILKDDEYAIRLLGAFCRKAKEASSDLGEHLDYRDISTKFPELIKSEWGVPLSAMQEQAMYDRTMIYSKDPEKSREFSDDSIFKRESATKEQETLSAIYIESQRLTFNQPKENGLKSLDRV